MRLVVSQRLQQLAPSATLAINARVTALREQGQDVLNFSVGEPDFPTPERICRAAQEAIRKGHTRYTEERGIKVLREAIAQRIALDYGLQYTAEQVTVTNGGKQALYNLFQALLNPGDEVLIPSPFWLSYPPQVLISEGVPVIVPTSGTEHFQIDPARLEALITPRTKAIVLNSPSNPTGVALTPETLRAVAELAIRHDLIIVTDDLYYRLVYDGFRFQSIASLVPEVLARTVIVGGVSKAYAMTGWRIGYALGPLPLIKAMNTLQGQTTSNPCSISQYAALEALKVSNDAEEEIAGMIRAFAERRARMVALLRDIPGVTCPMPDGAFYTFPGIESYLGRRTPTGQRLNGTVDLAAWLVEAAGIACIPGEVFGDNRHLRFSYACDMETIESGMQRFRSALLTLT